MKYNTLEVANALCAAERRKRITSTGTTAALAAFETMPIEFDTETGRRARRETLSLAREHALSAYAAACLELAMRHGSILASIDKPLRAAAKKLNVPTLPEAL